MSRFLRTIILVVATFVAAGAGRSEQVGMYGEYHEATGIIGNIPQNPPIVPCVPAPVPAAPPGHQTIMGAAVPSFVLPRATGANDARCATRSEQFLAVPGAEPLVFNQPLVGNKGARIANGGMFVGDPFTIPPFAFQQQLGQQFGVVLNNVTREITTNFIAAMPGTDRRSGMGGGFGAGAGAYTVRPLAAQQPVPVLTRMFSAMNWQNPGNGQNNNANPTTMRPTPFAQRLAANTIHFNSAAAGNEKVQVRYRAGANQFGGTMALLLGGSGKLVLGSNPSAMLPAGWQPAAATLPFPGQTLGLRVRNGHGWDIVAPAEQNEGRVKAFFGNFNTPMGLPRVGPTCVGSNPPTPTGCNHLAGFDTFIAGAFTTMTLMIPAGGTIARIPKATSLKHAFALTTGTASVIQVANRPYQGGVQTRTMTAMGYDTIGLSQMGSPQRNVGLVAGSYSIRTQFNYQGPVIQISSQILGLNLKFAPEPAATVALMSGLGLLGLLAYRRRA